VKPEQQLDDRFKLEWRGTIDMKGWPQRRRRRSDLLWTVCSMGAPR
jgi:hypothetical protein